LEDPIWEDLTRPIRRHALADGWRWPSAQAATRLLASSHRWEIRSAGAGSKGQRWYAWALLATASPRHHLLIRRHRGSGELAFHYCYLPGGQQASPARLIRAAGLRCSPAKSRQFVLDSACSFSETIWWPAPARTRRRA
jgi:hypothetical protein